MFCFTNILNIFFSFVACSMHKNPHQNAGNGIKETLFFKIFLEKMPRTPLEVLAPSVQVGQIRVCPPKISKPVRLCALWLSKFQFYYSYAVILINIYFFNCNFHEIIPKIVILVYNCVVFSVQHMH